jgi:hypothetical protein
MKPLLFQLSNWRRARRRRRNLHVARPAGARSWLFAHRTVLLAGMTAIALTCGGAALLWRHAASMAAHGGAQGASVLAPLQAVMPGLRFTVPESSSIAVRAVRGGTLLIAANVVARPAVRVDLCSRPLPLHIGYRFAEVAAEPTLRHALLAGDASTMPALTIGAAGGGLHARWRGRGAPAQWSADAPGAMMRTLGWLTWADGALRIELRASKACAQGEMLVQAYTVDASGRGPFAAARDPLPPRMTKVVAFAAHGPARELALAPGRYEVPLQAAAPHEDELLFRRLLARGLLRPGEAGLLDLAPADLAHWLSADAGMRAVSLPGWQGLRADDEMRGLLTRLYRQADGAYLRRQVDLFNAERRLLAWRLGNGVPAGVTLALAAPGGGRLDQSMEMPPVAVRLFADLPQGWQPWRRAAHWLGQGAATLVLQLPRPARGRERIELLLAGRLDSAAPDGSAGALRWTASDACSGPACRSAADVQAVALYPAAGTSRIALRVRALDVASGLLPGDQAYRHIRLAADGTPSWHAIRTGEGQPLPAAVRSARGGEQGAPITDRDGTVLWSDGAPTPAARNAGLDTLLGLHAGHASSLSGMLARAARIDGAALPARLSISLPLQALGQAILDCQGLRGGTWVAGRCEGAGATPPQRRAGLVLLDAANGDILLAAGAGGASVTADNWREARDFDRANPARSALRLPAWQHDGGAHNSPGSAFKIVSALGLELAARHDRVLDKLLGGMPLAQIDHVAQQRGFAFQTGAAAYPHATRSAHVTNYREQTLARRAEGGRLGLAQSMAHSVNTWFAWTAELSDQTLQGRPEGGAPGLRALEPGALEARRPIAAAASALGFGMAMRLDGGLLPSAFPWQRYDALHASPARIDPIDSRHELRQMAIGLRMQATPLQMAVAAAAMGSGRVPQPRLLLSLGARAAQDEEGKPLAVRLDRIRQGMKGVVDHGTAAGAFGGPELASIRRGLFGKTGTAPVTDDAATVWFTGWLEPGSLPGQERRLAFAVFVSHSPATGGGHAAPVVAALLKAMAARKAEQKEISPSIAANGWAGTMPR